MQCVKPKARRWWRPHLIRNTKEKTFEGKRKHGMTRRAINQASMPNLAQNLKRIRREFENMLEMMQKKEWLCNIFKIIS
jgi:hypothetical protein